MIGGQQANSFVRVEVAGTPWPSADSGETYYVLAEDFTSNGAEVNPVSDEILGVTSCDPLIIQYSIFRC